MNEWLTSLFDLQQLRFGEEGVELAFARPIPGWGWVLAALGVGALAVWSYLHLVGPKVVRAWLAGVRSLLVLTLLFVLSGPQLVRPDDRVEKDWVVVLVDRSASMGISDVPVEGTERRTREAQLRRSLEQSWPMWSKLAQERTVRWLGFDAGAYDLAPADRSENEEAGGGVLAGLGEPLGRRTQIGLSLEQALRMASARPVSGVVIFSDGRTVDEPTRATMRRLASEHIPVFVVPLGREEPLLDLAVAAVEAPAMAFLHDTVPVNVRIERIGSGESPVTVRLIDAGTGIVLDETTLPVGAQAWRDDAALVTLAAKPGDAGRQVWRVTVSTPVPDLIAENNTGEVVIEMVDRPLRVAYFDGYPRWEYRYVKNLLVRESSIRASAMLLAANRRYLQEGDYPLVTLPRSPEEWAEFDVVVLGDVRAELFSREQLEQLREHVASRGAGLLWIGGPGATPATWIETPLGDLLPFRAVSPPTGTPSYRVYATPVVVRRTPAAERLGLLELSDDPATGGWPERLSDPATGWSRLHWAQRIDPSALKPTAEVLAVAAPAQRSLVSGPGLAEALAEATPLVISMRYGAGRVVYVGTDEIWRWRYARGEELPERFWLPLMRLQGRESLSRAGRSATLEVSPRRAVVDQPIRIAVTILDQSLAELQLPAIRVAVQRADVSGAELDPQPILLRLTPEDAGATRTVTQTYSTTWLTSEAGRFVVEPREPTLAAMQLSAQLDVMLPDDELRAPEADHAFLQRLATQTGGQVLSPEALDSLPDLLPNREVRIVGIPTIETLWDHWTWLVVLVSLATVEWVVRKLIQLA